MSCFRGLAFSFLMDLTVPAHDLTGSSKDGVGDASSVRQTHSGERPSHVTCDPCKVLLSNWRAAHSFGPRPRCNRKHPCNKCILTSRGCSYDGVPVPKIGTNPLEPASHEDLTLIVPHSMKFGTETAYIGGVTYDTSAKESWLYGVRPEKPVDPRAGGYLTGALYPHCTVYPMLQGLTARDDSQIAVDNQLPEFPSNATSATGTMPQQGGDAGLR